MELVEHVDRLDVVVRHVLGQLNACQFRLVGHACEHEQSLEATEAAERNIRR